MRELKNITRKITNNSTIKSEKEEPIEVKEELKIIKLNLKPNPSYDGKILWGQRDLSLIKKIIVHQSLGNGDTLSVHNYHISEKSHLKKGGAPKIAYHFTIERDGNIYKVNEYNDITWHCVNQNTSSIGILVIGNFDGPSYNGNREPSEKQIESLKNLLDFLIDDLKVKKSEIYGHSDFGKVNCPGLILDKFILEYKS